MSGIEILTNFFENIRPRYSWSSSETATSSAENEASLPSNSSSAPSSSCSTTAPGNDGEEGSGSDRTLASPPTSPMSGLDLEGPDCGILMDDETDDELEAAIPSTRVARVVGQIGSTITQSIETQSTSTTGTMQTEPSIDAVASDQPPMLAPSEGPAEAIGRFSNANAAPAYVTSNPSNSNQTISTTSLVPETSATSNSSQAIPEDDGHRELRARLKEIQFSTLSEKDRAQKMHDLMTERYLSRAAQRRSISDISISSRPKSFIEGDLFKVSEQDKEQTFADEENGILGCQHYKRNVKLQCSICEAWYPCRFCHDEVEDHTLIRRDTKNMLCMHCWKAQPAAHYCQQCSECAASYYCDKCKLWDDDPKKTIYHCNDCGICRIGAGLGKDFFHCKTCGVCMAISLRDHHRCIERSTDCNCPICGEYLFTSVRTVSFMPKCGHSIHQECYDEHTKTSYRCPTCARSLINMDSRFRYLDFEIEGQPLPEPYKYWHCHIICNDCSAKSDTPFHFLGLKCGVCKSYNTCEVKLIRPEEENGQTSPGGSSLTTTRILPPHLMPNPETAGNLGENVVTDLASVLREIEGRDDQQTEPSETTEESDDDSECSCGRSHHDDEEDDDLYDSETYDSDEGLDEDEEEDDEDDAASSSNDPDIIRLPFHP